jgi:putative Mg2+ transporter-C (MgtC) family protein
VVTTAIYFVVALGFPEITRRLPQSSTAVSVIRIRYPDGRGVLRQLLQVATTRGFAIERVSTESIGHLHPTGPDAAEVSHGVPMVEVTLHLHGRSSVNELAAALSELDGVHAVIAHDVNAVDE